MTKTDRLFLEPSSSFEEGLTASLNKRCTNPVCISVTEEQAVDSYNCSFTCSMHLTVEQVKQLRDWLSAALGS